MWVCIVTAVFAAAAVSCSKFAYTTSDNDQTVILLIIIQGLASTIHSIQLLFKKTLSLILGTRRFLLTDSCTFLFKHILSHLHGKFIGLTLQKLFFCNLTKHLLTLKFSDAVTKFRILTLKRHDSFLVCHDMMMIGVVSHDSTVCLSIL